VGKNTKSRAISEKLRMEILSGKFDVSRKLPSEHQLMRRFSVARETIRGALKELYEKRLVDRKPGYGTFLADRAEISAAQKFGIVVPDAYYPFYTRICRGIEEAAKANGWTTLSAALQPKELGGAACSWPIIWVEGGCDVGQLVIDGVCRDERTTTVAPTVGVSPNASVEALVIRNCRQVNRASGDLVFLSQRGKVGRLTCENISVSSEKGAGGSLVGDGNAAQEE